MDIRRQTFSFSRRYHPSSSWCVAEMVAAIERQQPGARLESIATRVATAKISPSRYRIQVCVGKGMETFAQQGQARLDLSLSEVQHHCQTTQRCTPGE